MKGQKTNFFYEMYDSEKLVLVVKTPVKDLKSMFSLKV